MAKMTIVSAEYISWQVEWAESPVDDVVVSVLSKTQAIAPRVLDAVAGALGSGRIDVVDEISLSLDGRVLRSFEIEELEAVASLWNTCRTKSPRVVSLGSESFATWGADRDEATLTSARTVESDEERWRAQSFGVVLATLRDDIDLYPLAADAVSKLIAELLSQGVSLYARAGSLEQPHAMSMSGYRTAALRADEARIMSYGWLTTANEPAVELLGGFDRLASEYPGTIEPVNTPEGKRVLLLRLAPTPREVTDELLSSARSILAPALHRDAESETGARRALRHTEDLSRVTYLRLLAPEDRDRVLRWYNEERSRNSQADLDAEVKALHDKLRKHRRNL